MIYIGADHGGFKLKERLKSRLRTANIPYTDLGFHVLNPDDDYPIITACVARSVTKNKQHRGIIICRSGVGTSIAANKIRGVRAVLAHDAWTVARARRDDDVNVLCIGSEHPNAKNYWTIIQTFLRTRFRNAKRDRRRLKQIQNIEHGS
jgi:ribose 5-phosphate isomerase B